MELFRRVTYHAQNKLKNIRLRRSIYTNVDCQDKYALRRGALMLRFSNENSYLNWARNGVLSSGVGVAMYAQEHHRGAQLSGAGLLLLGFGYIGVGTIKYIFYTIRFRHILGHSWGSTCMTVGHAAGALIIWLGATACFLESIPLSLDIALLREPLVSFLPLRIREGLIDTYKLDSSDEDYEEMEIYEEFAATE